MRKAGESRRGPDKWRRIEGSSHAGKAKAIIRKRKNSKEETYASPSVLK
jgi:hypothetical protein